MGDDVKFGGKIRLRYTASGFVLKCQPFVVIGSFKNDILHHGINKYLCFSLSALFGRNKERGVHNFISG